ncbi:MAG: ribonuclease III [Deltaproteobacteria bacterium]|nr:MAG: ribonuclease III [Deltaproteobacteria bacterium]
MEDLNRLQEKIGYRFRDVRRLERALVHPSFAHERQDPEIQDYERFEFLGDAALDLVVSHLLLETYPDASEGELSRLRAATVNEPSLAEVARSFDLGRFLLLGKGEEGTQGREKDSILADACEALFAAIYLDGGFEALFAVVKRIFTPLIEATNRGKSYRDYKSKFQEYVQKTWKVVPSYQLIGKYGPPHDPIFEVHLLVRGEVYGKGLGRSKKLAEQEAARQALEEVETLQ